jgi:predicted N-formylglutamate amidohydrolase
MIDADEPPAFEVVNPNSGSRLVLTCDHASHTIPRRLETLGLGSEQQTRHIAWDLGAEALARQVAERLDATLMLTRYSRLVVDCNRPLNAPDAFAVRSEDVDIPGNRDLSDAERERRACAYFWPYHDAIDSIMSIRAESVVPMLVSLHSFTPVFHGRPRALDVGVLHRADRRLADLALPHFADDPDLQVGDNDPYGLALGEDYTVPVHGERRGVPCVLLEIRNDHLAGEKGIERWAERIGALLQSALRHADMAHPRAPAMDCHEPRYG